MKLLKTITLLALAAFLTACGSSGLDELKRLCEKDAGLTIFKTVEADGYYDDATLCRYCWHGLIDSPFKYIEFCDVDSVRNPLVNAIKEQGCYRLSKVVRNSGQCHAEIDEDIAKVVIEPFASFKKEQCIMVELIEGPRSLYRFVIDNKELWLDKSKGTLIRKTILRFEDVNNGTLIARDIVYSLISKNAGNELATSPVGCDSWAIANRPSPYYRGTRDKVLLEEVISKGDRND